MQKIHTGSIRDRYQYIKKPDINKRLNSLIYIRVMLYFKHHIKEALGHYW